jgi:hypothetical protein
MRVALPRLFPCLLALLLAPALGAAARASAARDELLRLVPDDVGLCLVIDDLRGHTERILASPWMKRFLASPLGQAVASSPEMKKLAKVDADLQQGLGVSLAQVRDDLLGEAVVLAYRPGPPGQHEQEQGFLLLRARRAELLSQVIDRFNTQQKKSGELKALEARQHQQVRYYRRQDVRGEHYYLQSGPLLAVSGQEAALRRVIELLSTKGPGRASQAAQGLRGTEGALASLWVNPRAYDAELRAKAATAKGPEAQVLQAFGTYWQAIDGISLALAVDRDLELRLAVRARPEALPAALRRLVETASRPSELWGLFPPGAVVTAAERLDFAALAQILADFQTPGTRESMRQGLQRSVGAAAGLDRFDDVLAHLGPDWGYCILANPDRAAFPHVLVALRIQPGPPEAPVDQAVLQALQSLAGVAVLAHNSSQKTPIRLKNLKQRKVEVKYLSGEGAWPAGLEPAFALKEGYLVLASTPAALERFAAAPAAVPPGGEVPLLRISFKELVRLLQERRPAVTGFLAEKNQVPPETAARWVDNLLSVLSLADQLELTQRGQAGQVTWTFRLRFEPLAP